MSASIADAMHEYFERFRTFWRSQLGDEPWVSRESDVSPDFYVGLKSAEDETCYWLPKRQSDKGFVKSIEGRFGISLHQDVFEYLSSYWFAEMFGGFGDFRIQMTPVLPVDGRSSVESQIATYRHDRNGELRYVPIGTEAASNGWVVVDNSSGQVLLDDFERQEMIPIASSLRELISGLNLDE